MRFFWIVVNLFSINSRHKINLIFTANKRMEFQSCVYIHFFFLLLIGMKINATFNHIWNLYVFFFALLERTQQFWRYRNWIFVIETTKYRDRWKFKKEEEKKRNGPYWHWIEWQANAIIWMTVYVFKLMHTMHKKTLWIRSTKQPIQIV